MMFGILVSSMKSDRGTPTASRVPPELGIGGGTSPFGKTKPLPSQVHGDARGPRHAHLDGFDLHANVWVGPADRARLEQLCRYVLRPPLAENRLRRLADGRVRLELKRAWFDGTTLLLFEPPRVPREAGGAHTTTRDQSRPVPRGAGPARAVAARRRRPWPRRRGPSTGFERGSGRGGARTHRLVTPMV